MCNCIKNLEKDLVGKIINRKMVVKAKVHSDYFVIGEVRKFIPEMELELEGQKKKIKKPIHLNYCPLCGEKYPEPEEWKTIPA